MLFEMVKNSRVAFMRWVWGRNTPDASPLMKAIRAMIRILFILFAEFQRDNIPLRSSALTFTVVLSLIPTLALGTAVLKGLGAGDQMRQVAYRFIDQIDSTEKSSPQDMLKRGNARDDIADLQKDNNASAVQESYEAEGEMDKKLTGHLRTAADQIFDYVERTDFATLGAFGVIGLVIAVISVLGSIEQAMNTIWRVKSGRPLGRKLMDYLALMIMLPLSINLALATETMLQNQSLFFLANKFLPVGWIGHFILEILPVMLVVATFTILYRFLPNTKVKMLPAFAGGVVGGAGWFIIQELYVSMQIGVARYNAIYGSFATLPLFFLWIYIGWIIFLAGAEFSFACQGWRNYAWKKAVMLPAARISLAFSVLETVFDDYRKRKQSSVDSLSFVHQSNSVMEIQMVLDVLVSGKLIRKVRDKGEGFVPSGPAENIQPAEIFQLFMGDGGENNHPMTAAALEGAVASMQKLHFSRINI